MWQTHTVLPPLLRSKLTINMWNSRFCEDLSRFPFDNYTQHIDIQTYSSLNSVQFNWRRRYFVIQHSTLLLSQSLLGRDLWQRVCLWYLRKKAAAHTCNYLMSRWQCVMGTSRALIWCVALTLSSLQHQHLWKCHKSNKVYRRSWTVVDAISVVIIAEHSSYEFIIKVKAWNMVNLSFMNLSWCLYL